MKKKNNEGVYIIIRSNTLFIDGHCNFVTVGKYHAVRKTFKEALDLVEHEESKEAVEAYVKVLGAKLKSYSGINELDDLFGDAYTVRFEYEYEDGHCGEERITFKIGYETL